MNKTTRYHLIMIDANSSLSALEVAEPAGATKLCTDNAIMGTAAAAAAEVTSLSDCFNYVADDIIHAASDLPSAIAAKMEALPFEVQSSEHGAASITLSPDANAKMYDSWSRSSHSSASSVGKCGSKTNADSLRKVALLNLTPLSSLPPSSSLIRHLMELRRKQEEVRRKQEEFLQSASPCLSSNMPKQVTNTHRVLGKHDTGNLPFSTSTPHSESNDVPYPNCQIANDYSPVQTFATDIAVRRPLTMLAFDKSNSIEDIDITCNCLDGKNSSCVNSKCKVSDENHPPQNQNIETPSHSLNYYNPNVYRSPPKKAKKISKTLSKACTGSDTKVMSQLNLQTDVKTGFSLTALASALSSPSSDWDRPITCSNQSFEELVMEKIKADTYSSPTDTPVPKKKFLKKGAGIARYVSPNDALDVTPKRKPVMNESVQESDQGNSEPKKKFPYLKKGDGTKRFYCRPVKMKKLSAASSANASVNTNNNTIPLDKLILFDNIDNDCSTPLNHRYNSHPRNNLVLREVGTSHEPPSPIIAKHPRREFEELKAFERLEELAENSSFCSDASTVNSLLQKGLDCSDSSTPIKYPVRSAFQVGVPTTSQPLESFQKSAGKAYFTQPPNLLAHDQDSRCGSRRVQFSEQGAQVMEYSVTESEEPTVSDASDMLNASDLEALNLLHQGKIMNLPVDDQIVGQYPVQSDSDFEGVMASNLVADQYRLSNRDLASEAIENSFLNDPLKSLCVNTRENLAISSNPHPPPRHTVLHFSPPRVPPDAASYPVWKAFGSKKKNAGCAPKQSLPPKKQILVSALPKNSESVTSIPYQNSSKTSEAIEVQAKELEASKVLLVAKVHELETEITTFRKENSQLNKMKETLQREKDQFNKERRMFEVTLAEDRRRMEQYFEVQQNKLWREKCALESGKQTVDHKTNTLEVINLKEEILLLKKELEKRDSTNNFALNKLRERIKEADRQKKDMEKKVEKLNMIEKENLLLKHQIDRLKLTSKLAGQKSVRSKTETLKPAIKLQDNLVKTVNFSLPDVSIVDVRPTQRNSSFIASNFEGNASSSSGNISNSITIQSTTNTSPYDSYLNKLPLNSSTLNCSVQVNDSNSSSNRSSMQCSEVTQPDGSRLFTYANGNKKSILPSGSVIMEYYNGDRKETYSDREVYYYSENGTKQTTHHGGQEVLEFPDGQKEIRHRDGSVEVVFPDGTRKVTRGDSSEVYHCADGTLITSATNGEKVFQFCNGQKEVQGEGFKRREYPDGTVKVVYADGAMETRYPNGRIRIKDGQGKLVSDTRLGKNLTVASDATSS